METTDRRGRTWTSFLQGLVSEKLRRYFQNLTWLLLEKVLSLFVALLVNIYVARYLQPDQFGLLNYAISFVGIFSVFSSLGLDQLVIREIARSPERRDELMGTAFVLKGIGSLGTIILVVLALTAIRNDHFTNTLILIIAMAEIFRAFDVAGLFFQAKVRAKCSAQPQLIVNLLMAGGKMLMVYLEAPLIWFGWATVASALASGVAFIFAYRKNEASLAQWRFCGKTAFSLVRESWPLVIYGIALYVQARIDQVMLGKMLSNQAVGQYSVAMKMIEICGFVPMVVMSTFTPAITRAKEDDAALYEERLLNFYRLMFLLFLVTAIPLFLFAEDVITLLYGENYRAAGALLSVFSFRLFYTNMGVAKSVFILNESLFRYTLGVTLVGAGVNVGCNFLLIPIYGTDGAVAATFISFTISIFLCDVFFAKTRINQRLMFRAITSFWRLNPL